MGKHAWAAVVTLLCLQCGGSTPPAETVEETQPEPAAEPPPAEEAPAGEGEGAETAEPTEPPAEETPPEGSAGGEKKSCAELDKNTCKITTGCAWNDVKKCVEEGASE